MSDLVPFSQASSTTIRGLTVETDETTLILYGNLEIARDQKSLEAARRLLHMLSSAVADLEQASLPSEALPPPTQEIDNPFA